MDLGSLISSGLQKLIAGKQKLTPEAEAWLKEAPEQVSDNGAMSSLGQNESDAGGMGGVMQSSSGAADFTRPAPTELYQPITGLKSFFAPDESAKIDAANREWQAGLASNRLGTNQLYAPVASSLRAGGDKRSVLQAIGDFGKQVLTEGTLHAKATAREAETRANEVGQQAKVDALKRTVEMQDLNAQLNPTVVANKAATAISSAVASRRLADVAAGKAAPAQEAKLDASIAADRWAAKNEPVLRNEQLKGVQLENEARKFDLANPRQEFISTEDSVYAIDPRRISAGATPLNINKPVTPRSALDKAIRQQQALLDEANNAPAPRLAKPNRKPLPGGSSLALP